LLDRASCAGCLQHVGHPANACNEWGCWTEPVLTHDGATQVKEIGQNTLKFILSNTDASIANSLRRCMISEVPTICIDLVEIEESEYAPPYMLLCLCLDTQGRCSAIFRNFLGRSRFLHCFQAAAPSPNSLQTRASWPTKCWPTGLDLSRSSQIAPSSTTDGHPNRCRGESPNSLAS